MNIGQTVLIVDDERFMRTTLGEALRAWNYETMEADSVASAKHEFDRELPPIVLLDIDLPDGSGLDVLNYIKERQPGTIAIMVTGNVDVPNAANATATIKEANGNTSTVFLVKQSGRWRIRSVQPA